MQKRINMKKKWRMNIKMIKDMKKDVKRKPKQENK
jgi:hypothetical protein